MDNRLRYSLLVLGLAGLFAAFAPRAAEAQQQATSCGGIYVSADTMCEILVEGGCTAQCEPINFTASCSADLYVSCDGMCNASFEASCTTDCSANCMASCEVDPGMFDCQADCTADIGARCDAQCSAEAAGSQAAAECHSSCETTFEAECNASCEATPPMADCMASCQASCEGSCTAEANVDCQVSCQADGYVDCETMLTGGCQTSCMEPTGGLFCDGQYVDASSIDACLMQLSDFEVMTDTSATAMCDSTGCEATADASASCAVSPVAPGRPTGAGWLALLGLPLIALLRRRR